MNWLIIMNEELFAPGHRVCAGCGGTVAARLFLKVLGKNTIVVNATGCLEVSTTMYPETSWRIPWIHVAFENTAAVASGIDAALKKMGKREGINIVAFAGDGGTADIGFQALSGAAEREHDIIYICYDNEAYMNTGVQRSGLTPYGAMTTTSPFGKVQKKKDMPLIMSSHDIPYVATASISYPRDYMRKVKKASEKKGLSYIHVHAPCPTGWGFVNEKSIEIGRLAVASGMWVLYEIEDGVFNLNIKTRKRIPVRDYITAQSRFKHLSEEEIEGIQKEIDDRFERLGK